MSEARELMLICLLHPVYGNYEESIKTSAGPHGDIKKTTAIKAATVCENKYILALISMP